MMMTWGRAVIGIPGVYPTRTGGEDEPGLPGRGARRDGLSRACRLQVTVASSPRLAARRGGAPKLEDSASHTKEKCSILAGG